MSIYWKTATGIALTFFVGGAVHAEKNAYDTRWICSSQHEVADPQHPRYGMKGTSLVQLDVFADGSCRATLQINVHSPNGNYTGTLQSNRCSFSRNPSLEYSGNAEVEWDELGIQSTQYWMKISEDQFVFSSSDLGIIRLGSCDRQNVVGPPWAQLTR